MTSRPAPHGGAKPVHRGDSRNPGSGEGSADRPAAAPVAPSPPAPSPTGGSAAAIASALQRSILSGEYPHAERLPAERDLALQFGTSRSTIREALRQLEDLKLVKRRIGSGTYVDYKPVVSQDDIAEATSPLELIEVRAAMEPAMARLAVLHGTARDLERLSECLAVMEGCGADREVFSEADETFHLGLAEATHNPLMIWIYRHVTEVRGHAQWESMKRAVLGPEEIAEYNRQHRTLTDAIVARDADTAERLIREHLETARQALLGARGGA